MKTISLESTPVAKTSSFKSLLAVFFQWLGASVGFIASMIIADMLSPLPAFIMQEIPESGFMPQGAAEVRKATLTLNLTPRGQRGGVSKQAVEQRLREALAAVPGVQVKVGFGGSSGEKYIPIASGCEVASQRA